MFHTCPIQSIPGTRCECADTGRFNPGGSKERARAQRPFPPSSASSWRDSTRRLAHHPHRGAQCPPEARTFHPVLRSYRWRLRTRTEDDTFATPSKSQRAQIRCSPFMTTESSRVEPVLGCRKRMTASGVALLGEGVLSEDYGQDRDTRKPQRCAQPPQ